MKNKQNNNKKIKTVQTMIDMTHFNESLKFYKNEKSSESINETLYKEKESADPLPLGN